MNKGSGSQALLDLQTAGGFVTCSATVLYPIPLRRETQSNVMLHRRVYTRSILPVFGIGLVQCNFVVCKKVVTYESWPVLSIDRAIIKLNRVSQKCSVGAR